MQKEIEDAFGKEGKFAIELASKKEFRFQVTEADITGFFSLYHVTGMFCYAKRIAIVMKNREGKWYGTHMGILPYTSCTKMSFDEVCRTLAHDYTVEYLK